MKFYSEITKTLYNTESELIKAEARIKEAEVKKAEAEKAKKVARATKAKEVEAALKAANEAQAKAIKLLKDFTNEYGYFHTSYTFDDVKKKEEEKEKAKTNSIKDDDFLDLLSIFLS